MSHEGSKFKNDSEILELFFTPNYLFKQHQLVIKKTAIFFDDWHELWDYED